MEKPGDGNTKAKIVTEGYEQKKICQKKKKKRSRVMRKGVDKASKCTSISTRTKLGIFVAAAINNYLYISL